MSGPQQPQQGGCSIGEQWAAQGGVPLPAVWRHPAGEPPPCPYGHMYVAPDGPEAARLGIGSAGLRFAALGLAVHPLRQGSKRPATERGFKDATTEPAVIAGWWEGSRGLNLGIATGAASGGMFVIDLDRKNGKDGPAAFMAWLAERGLHLPPGPWADTPSGGVHLFIRSDGRPIQTRAGVLPGVDIRGDGGYAAAWPSGIRMPRGMRRPGDPPPKRNDPPEYGTYRWHGCPCQIPAAPAALLDALEGLHGTGNGGGGNGTGWTGDMPTLPPTAELLERGLDHPHDVNLARLAGRLAGDGLTWEQAYPILRRVADITAIAERWPDDNLKRKFDSARAKGFGVGPAPETVAWAHHQAGGQQAASSGADPQSAQMAARVARRELDEHNSKWLYGHDVNQLDFILCVAITGGSAEDGEKLWGIVVNSSSSAKSEGIKMLFGVADARLSDLTAAGLISWIGTGRNMKVTGLLTRLPSPAFVLIEDLAPILSDTADTRNRSKLVSLLRRAYDGEVQRNLGGTPGQAVWSGKVTILAASTKVIDQQSALLDEAGPRWLLYRGTEASAVMRLDGTGRRINSKERAVSRARARELATEVVRHGRAAFASMELSEQAAGTLGDISVAVGIMRGNVPRDGYGRRDIIGVASTEEPWRLEAQLQLLSRAAMAFGHTEDSAVGLARTVALGTVSPDRMKVLEVLSPGGQHSASSIGREKGMHRHVARRALEDLQQLRVTQCINEDQVSDDPLTATGMAKLWGLAGTDEAGVISQVILDAGAGTKSERYGHFHTQ